MNEMKTVLENKLRDIIDKTFQGEVKFERLMPGMKSCIIKHDGFSGFVMVSSILRMGTESGDDTYLTN